MFQCETAKLNKHSRSNERLLDSYIMVKYVLNFIIGIYVRKVQGFQTKVQGQVPELFKETCSKK